MNNLLKGKKVLITGASPDLGQILAIRFAEMGAQLFLVARTRGKAEKTSNLVRSFTSCDNIYCYGSDLRYSSEISSMITELHKDSDAIDILINNAGYWLQGDFCNVNDSDISEAINSTLTGSALITKHMIPLLMKSDNPYVVNISSLSADSNTSEPAHEAYSAAKYGMGVFSDRLRGLMQESGIRITTIYPPKFVNHRPNVSGKWDVPDGLYENLFITDKHLFETILLILSQDPISCISEIYISNNSVY